jgi:hypothetical protein
VDGAKLTVAAPFRSLRWIEPPDTDWTRPSMWSLPMAGGGGTAGGGAGLGAELVGLAAGGGFSALPLFDVPHAPTDSAVTAITAS